MEETVIKINVQRKNSHNECIIYIQTEIWVEADQDAFSPFSDDPKYMGQKRKIKRYVQFRESLSSCDL